MPVTVRPVNACHCRETAWADRGSPRRRRQMHREPAPRARRPVRAGTLGPRSGRRVRAGLSRGPHGARYHARHQDRDCCAGRAAARDGGGGFVEHVDQRPRDGRHGSDDRHERPAAGDAARHEGDQHDRGQDDRRHDRARLAEHEQRREHRGGADRGPTQPAARPRSASAISGQMPSRKYDAWPFT